MNLTQEQRKLFEQIYAVFGNAPKPKFINGSPREPWQDAFLRKDLCDISEDEFFSAVCHVFPGHYGDIVLLRYLLSGCLYMFCFEESEKQNIADKHSEKVLQRVSDSIWKEGFSTFGYEDILTRCVEWKAHLNPQEIEVIGELLKFSFILNVNKRDWLVYWYFTVMLTWFKDCNVFESIVKNTNVDIDSFIEEAWNLSTGYWHINNFSILAAVLGLYGSFWPECDVRIFPYRIQRYFTEKEFIELEKQLRYFFLMD